MRLRLAPNEPRELVPGDIIGRVWSAALQIADPLVSEAHAMVSLREGALKLLGLRGRLVVDGKVVPEVRLVPGLAIGLSPTTVLEVCEVALPPALVAIEHPELGKRVLSGVCSLVRDRGLTLTAGSHPKALAVVWSDGLGWFARLHGGLDVPLPPGEVAELGEVALNVTLVSLDGNGEVTSYDPKGLEAPLRLVARYDTFHIHRGRGAPLALDGIIARILSELAIAAVPVGWHLIAESLWPGEQDRIILRRNWDAALARLRKKLKQARLRLDLVRSDRSGNFELFLQKGDRVEDRT